MHIEIDLPEQIASILTTLPLKELKKRIITENGLTIAQEEEILHRAEDTKNHMGPLTKEEFMAELHQWANPE